MSELQEDPRFPVGSIGIRTIGDSIRAGLAFDEAAERYQREFNGAMAAYAAQFPFSAQSLLAATAKEPQTP
jgi:hypothetical protein